MDERSPGRAHTVFAQLNMLYSADVDPTQSKVPDDPECFSISVQAIVGQRDDQRGGGDTFEFVVCTPRWLESEITRTGYQFGRHLLIVARYDYSLIEQAIRKIIDGVSGTSWSEVAERIARYGHWEFEDYVE